MKCWLLCALLLYTSTTHVGNAFTHVVSTTKCRPKSTWLSDSPREDRGTTSSSRKRRQRYVDFPSSYYKKVPSRSAKQTPKKGRKAKGEKSMPFVKVDPSIDSFISFSDTAGSPLEADLSDMLKNAERTRLLTSRAYARREPFAQANITSPPMLNDLSPSPRKTIDTYWAGAPFRVVVFAAAYFAFPYLTQFLESFVSMSPTELDEIAGKFTPGISILYGTFVSLTISILYNRQQSIQEQVSTESSMIALLERNVLSIFRADKNSAIEASQCVADQIRTLVRSSRGKELMGIMYSDPYARILELIEERELDLIRKSNDLGGQGAVIGSTRDIIKDLMRIRAQRLSSEALALPSTHFFILTVLTVLILLGYSISILPTVPRDGMASNESSFLFSILCTTYVIFYSFAKDLNDAFVGVYQIRRSSTATHLLQTKWLIANHPLVRGEVDFDEVEESIDGAVRIRSPGLGDMLIDGEGFYPRQVDEDDDDQGENDE